MLTFKMLFLCVFVVITQHISDTYCVTLSSILLKHYKRPIPRNTEVAKAGL